jgi:hypothetical protein
MWPFKKRDWTPEIEKVVRRLMTGKSLDEIHTELTDAGVRDEDATKLVLFTPSTFAREMFEPQGVQFTDTYFRSDDAGRTRRRKSYVREAIYQQARMVARHLIEHQRFEDVRMVASISAEAKLVEQADARSGSLLQVLEITHNF